MKTLLALIAAAPVAMLVPNGAEADNPAERRAEDVPAVTETTPDEQCRDRIRQVRSERGLPRLERRTADPESPLFIAAVDQRLEGCSVLVMRHDTSDIRPLPEVEDSPPRLQPAW